MIAGQNLAGEGLCYVVIMRFCRDIGFVAFTRFFGLGLTQILRILVKFCADIQGVPKKWCTVISLHSEENRSLHRPVANAFVYTRQIPAQSSLLD